MSDTEREDKVGRLKGAPPGKIDESQMLLRLTAASGFFAKEEAGQAFLESYGISFATAKHFGVGLELDGVTPVLTFPLFNEAREIVDVHFLNTSTKEWSRLNTRAPAPLFGQNRLIYRQRTKSEDGEVKQEYLPAPDEVFVAQSVLDAMALYEIGIENVVGMTLRKKILADQWVEALRRVGKSIYFVFGKQTMKKMSARETWELARQVGVGKASFITLPADTMVEWALERPAPRSDFEDLAIDAVKVLVHNVKAWDEIFHEYRDLQAFGDLEGREEEILFDWYFDNLREILGIPKPGNYCMVVSEPKMGKTGLLSSIGARNGDAGRRGLFYCLEEKRTEIFERMVQSSLGVELRDVGTPAVMTQVERLYDHMQVYFCDWEPHAGNVVDAGLAIIEKMRDAVQRYALRWVVFDNIHWLIRNSRNPEMDTATISREFKRFAKVEGVVLIMLAHPRKMDDGKPARPRDMKYSGSLAGDCDGMLFMDRKEAEDQSAVFNEGGVATGARSPLTRFYAEGRKAPGGRAVLMYEGLYSRFRRLTKEEMDELRTAWERDQRKGRSKYR